MNKDEITLQKYLEATKTVVNVDPEVLKLCKEICDDFEEYHFLDLDAYKGKIKGYYNLYLKKGLDNKVGMVTGVKNHDKFGLEVFDKNFITFTFKKYEEPGWTGEQLVKVLEHIKSVLIS